MLVFPQRTRRKQEQFLDELLERHAQRSCYLVVSALD